MALMSGKPTLLCSHLTHIVPGSKPRRRHEALLEEISTAGAVLSLDCPLKRGTDVRIDCRTCELRGKVVGCRKWAGGYAAEVAFAVEEPWQPADFKPDGLFNPNSLVCTNPGCQSDCVDESCGGAKTADL
jgi:hypothetical protein